MTGYRQTLLVLLLTILSGAAVAQNNTNSPYTRYGYGQLSEQGSSNSRAMGGIAYGLRDKWEPYKGEAAEIHNKVNDAYLKANNQTDGVQSYGRMVDLLIAQYEKEKSAAAE